MSKQYKLRVYYLPYDKNWARLQLVAAAPSREGVPAGLGRRTIYRNAVLTNFVHLKARRADRAGIFESLVGKITAGVPFSGLESIYLTMLADPAVRQLPSCAHSLNLWHGRVSASTADAGTLFYNEVGDRLSLLLPTTLHTLKPGGVNSSLVASSDSLATHIESIADAVVNLPFSSARTTSLRTNEAASETKALVDGLNLTAGALALGAGLMALIPGGQLGAAAAAYAAASGAVWTLGASLTYVQDLVATNSVTTTMPTSTPPNGAPVCGPNGEVEAAFSSQPSNDGGGEGGDGGSGSVGGGTDTGTGAGTGQGGGEGGGEGGGGEGGGGEGGGGEGGGGEGGGGEGGGGDGCFAAGTPVVMADGTWKDVATIAAGDRVLWLDHMTGENGTADVVAVKASLNQSTWRLIFDDDSILQTTAYQPFHYEDASPAVAMHLTEGDSIVAATEDGNLTRRIITHAARNSFGKTVYDLRIGPDDRFLVGLARIPTKKKI